jgi:hypothetical protein
VSLRAHASYGQHGLTPVDRFGVWLSKRAIHHHLPSADDLEVLELGCGYRATQLMALERKLKRGIGVDFQIAPELQTLEKFTFYQGTIEQNVRMSVRIQFKSRDRRSQNVSRQTRSLDDAGSCEVQAESDPIAVPQVRPKSFCSCQEGRPA